MVQITPVTLPMVGTFLVNKQNDSQHRRFAIACGNLRHKDLSRTDYLSLENVFKNLKYNFNIEILHFLALLSKDFFHQVILKIASSPKR